MNNDWPEYIAAKPDKTWANMPHGQTYVHIRRHILISGNLDDARKRIAGLEAQLAQRDAALKAADELYDAIMDCQCNEGIEESILGYCPAKRLYAAQDAYDKARGRDA